MGLSVELGMGIKPTSSGDVSHNSFFSFLMFATTEAKLLGRIPHWLRKSSGPGWAYLGVATT
jgi:hypothetical protein